MTTENMTTAAQQLLEVCARLNVKHIFTNLGSDHPAFVEAFANLHAQGKPMPKIIICPHEMTTLSAAHGYTMITNEPQAVLVHVDVGTQNLGGSVHNAARGRIPAIIVAGLSPSTETTSRTASRNEFIHYIQDTSRQHEIVAQYMKWCYELRNPEMVDDIVLRGMQIARTEPQGPIYITGAREVWDDFAPESAESPADWTPARLAGLNDAGVDELLDAIKASRRPIIITQYLGRQTEAVGKLVELSDKLGLGVCEGPQYLSFPGDHPHHLSYRRNTLVDEADLIIIIDADVPWLPTKVRPAAGAQVFHIDVDPLKQDIGFWHFPAKRTWQADSLQVLEQLLAKADRAVEGREARVEWIKAARARVNPDFHLPTSGPISAAELSFAIKELVTERTRIVFEEPSSTEILPSVLRMNRPGSYFASGGSGLGWGTNAAIGAKLADPDAEVIAVVGDGCYKFGVPSSTYWVADTYQTPFLTIIYNNAGWHSPKLSTVWVHPQGTAATNDTYWVTISAKGRLAEIAAASGDVAAFQVKERETLKATLKEAMDTVRGGRSAVVEVFIEPISHQVL